MSVKATLVVSVFDKSCEDYFINANKDCMLSRIYCSLLTASSAAKPKSSLIFRCGRETPKNL